MGDIEQDWGAERQTATIRVTDSTELLTCPLIKVAREDDFSERLLARKGRIPNGTLFAG